MHTTQKQKNPITNPHNLIKEWAEDMNRHLSKRDITDGQLDIKRCSIPLSTRERQIKITIRQHPHICQKGHQQKDKKKQTSVRMLKKKKKKEPFCPTAKKVNWCSHCGKQYEGSSKNLKRELPYDPAIPLLGIFQRK